MQKIMNGDIGENFLINQDGILVMKGKDDLRKAIMKEAYYFVYAMHPSSTKMYRTIKENYWWSGVKKT